MTPAPQHTHTHTRAPLQEVAALGGRVLLTPKTITDLHNLFSVSGAAWLHVQSYTIYCNIKIHVRVHNVVLV